MGIYIHGLKFGDDPTATKLSSSTSVNTSSHSVFGSSRQEVEIVSIGEKTLQMEMFLDYTVFESLDHNVEFISEHLNGLVERLAPLHIRSDEVPIYGGAKDIFVMIDKYSVNWKAGTEAHQMKATVSIDAVVLGTLGNLQAKYGVISQQRNGDYIGDIAGKSVVSIPGREIGDFVQVHNIEHYERRNGTLMIDLGDVATGFANDTTSADAFDAEVGEVVFNIDVTNRNFLANEIRVYDEGYTPRMRVYSTTHEFEGDLVIESELYKCVVDVDTSQIKMHRATALDTYAGSPFVTVTLSTFNDISMVMNKEHFVRVRTDTGDYFEIERGKDPILQLQNNDNGFTISDTTSGATTPTVNYVNFGSNLYIASNYEFTATSGAITPDTSDLTDQVYQIVYYDTSLITDPAGGNGLGPRLAECLKEIS